MLPAPNVAPTHLSRWSPWPTWALLLEYLEGVANGNQDFQAVGPHDLYMQDSSLVYQDVPYRLDEFALQQLGRMVGPWVNSRYWGYFPPQEVEDQVNRLLHRADLQERQWTLRVGAHPAPWVRAILGPGYSAYDHVEMVRKCGELLEPRGYLPTGVHLDRQVLAIRSLNQDPKSSIPLGFRGGQPDTCVSGVYLWNSEVGQRSVGATAFLLRPICSNGAFILEPGEGGRRRHVGQVGIAFEELLEQAIASGPALVALAQRAATLAVEDPNMLIYALCEVGGLPEGLAPEVVDTFYTEEEHPTRWGVANAFTRYAQETPTLELQEQLETFGGRLLRDDHLLRMANLQVEHLRELAARIEEEGQSG